MEMGTDMAAVEAAEQQLKEQAEQQLIAEPLTNKNKIVSRIADRFGVDGTKLLHTLRVTCFSSNEVSNEQMMMMLIVCEQYGLNPFVKEIYAFLSKHGGIIPVVSVDGWLRIINAHPDYDGCEFAYSAEMETQPEAKQAHAWIECSMHRKGIKFPMVVREYLDEVYVPKTGRFPGPWQTHTKRMHRHKTLIQAARYAFGFAGIYDADEAQRIIKVESDHRPAQTNNSADFTEFQRNLQAASSRRDAGDLHVIDVEAVEVASPITTSEVAADYVAADPVERPAWADESADEAVARLLGNLQDSKTTEQADAVGAEIRYMKARFPGFDNSECLGVYLEHRQALINNRSEA